MKVSKIKIWKSLDFHANVDRQGIPQNYSQTHTPIILFWAPFRTVCSGSQYCDFQLVSVPFQSPTFPKSQTAQWPMGKSGNHHRYLAPSCIWFDWCWNQTGLLPQNLSLANSRVPMGLSCGGSQNHGYSPQGVYDSKLSQERTKELHANSLCGQRVCMLLDCIHGGWERAGTRWVSRSF